MKVSVRIALRKHNLLQAEGVAFFPSRQEFLTMYLENTRRQSPLDGTKSSKTLFLAAIYPGKLRKNVSARQHWMETASAFNR